MPKTKPKVPSPQVARMALDNIHSLYDGQEVDSDTHDQVMEILRVAGYVVRDPADMPEES